MTVPEPDAESTEEVDIEEIAAMSDLELAETTYVAGYPLVVSIRTMQQLGGLLGTNDLFWQTARSGPDSRIIVAPNRDTLYSDGPFILMLRLYLPGREILARSWTPPPVELATHP